MDDERPTVVVYDEWDYPPMRLPDGTELTGEQVRAVIVWYWQSGQGDEDLAGIPSDYLDRCKKHSSRPTQVSNAPR